MTKAKPEHTSMPGNLETPGNELILFNDDVNTFDFVIESLIEVCKHTPEQAEQCAIIAHTNGKCGIKTGEHAALEPVHNELGRRGLSTVII